MSDEAIFLGSYVTTTAVWNERMCIPGGGHMEASFPNPEPPADGYVLVGSAATDHRLFWFWKRERRLA